MILLDLSQVSIAAVMTQMNTKNELDMNIFRHIVLSTIRTNINKFKDEYGKNLVIACDNKNVWRKRVFPYYKAHRKIDREESSVNWNEVFKMINTMKEELKEYFPYFVIDVETAEADDIIATMCELLGVDLGNGSERVMILSGDKDFVQLQKYSNVDQYDPVRKKAIRTNNPEQHLMEHILKGDRGDGVPNVLSPDDIIITGGRQRSLTQKKIDLLMGDITKADSDTQRNFERNKMLIDFSCIPPEVKSLILSSYMEQKDNKDRSKLFNYFITNKLKNLTEHLVDF